MSQTENFVTEALPKAAEVFAEKAAEILAETPVDEKPKRKRTRTKKEETTSKKRSRELSELTSAPTKTMTDKEKDKLIEHYRDEIATHNIKVASLKQNCESAYAKLRLCEEDYVSMEKYYKERLGFIDQQVTAFGNAVKLSIIGGIK